MGKPKLQSLVFVLIHAGAFQMWKTFWALFGPHKNQSLVISNRYIVRWCAREDSSWRKLCQPIILQYTLKTTLFFSSFNNLVYFNYIAPICTRIHQIVSGFIKKWAKTWALFYCSFSTVGIVMP